MDSKWSTPPGTKGSCFRLYLLGILFLSFFLCPVHSFGRIFIDINAPSVQKFKIAIPDFKDLSSQNKRPGLASKLPEVISNDLDLSGYFSPMDKEAFLEENEGSISFENIRFRDWSVIGAELLVLGTYTCIGSSLEVEIRLLDVFSGRQILGKRTLGDLNHYRYLIHRLSNQIIETLTGHAGIFLTKVAFVSNASGHKEIYTCDYDGHNVRQITRDKSIALLPRWSPAGEKLGYTSYKEGGPMFYLKDIASGAVRRLSGKTGLNIGASWSPDSSKIALTLSPKGNPDIFTIDLNGKVMKRLTNYWGIDVSPSFSPDGSRIAFVSNRKGSPQIFVLDLKSGKEERLTCFPEGKGQYNTSPSWSSLNRIAFVSMNQGHFDIFTMHMDGNRLTKLTENQGNNEDPCWSPDGRYIMFSSDREGPYRLYIMNANGQNQREITFFDGDHTSPSWAP